MTKEEQNRKLAEWFEPKPEYVPENPGMLDVLLFSTSGAWSIEYGDGGLCECPDGSIKMLNWKPRDFFSHEGANALLLEKFPEPDLWVESTKDEPKLWACTPDIMQPPPPNPLYVLTTHADRKTSICLAAIQFLEAFSGTSS